jgi:hypothetical protein
MTLFKQSNGTGGWTWDRKLLLQCIVAPLLLAIVGGIVSGLIGWGYLRSDVTSIRKDVNILQTQRAEAIALYASRGAKIAELDAKYDNVCGNIKDIKDSLSIILKMHLRNDMLKSKSASDGPEWREGGKR